MGYGRAGGAGDSCLPAFDFRGVKKLGVFPRHGFELGVVTLRLIEAEETEPGTLMVRACAMWEARTLG